MPRRPCLTCSNHLAEPGKPRCTECERDYQRRRNASRPQYAGNWAADARAQIAAHRATHGDRCPGWQRPPHAIHPDEWTCDHDVGPLCRSCNGAKGGGHDRRRAQAERTLTDWAQRSGQHPLGVGGHGRDGR